jgi:hypothetical protein
MARPTFNPTDEQRRQVENLAAFGVPVEQIVHLVLDKAGKPISEKTLRKYFRTELATGHVKANAKIAKTLFEKAAAGDTTAMIFWLKTRARWKEVPQAVELTGAAGGPMEHVGMTPSEFEKVARRVADEV